MNNVVKVRRNLMGQHFGKLKVIKQADDYIAPDSTHYAQWFCECSCEAHNTIIARTSNLTNGSTVSCGCYDAERKAQRKRNTYDVSGQYGILWLTNTNKKCYFDLEDVDKISQYTWLEDGNGYAITTIDGKNISMHRMLGYYAPDHHNRNKLDNRKENLIMCTSQENARNRSKYSRNTSGFIGVGWSKDKSKWRARIHIGDKEKFIGYFTNKEDAIKARLQAEVKYFGDFAPQRHLFEQYNINTNISF